MFQSLLNCEWIFLSQMIYRINQCETYDEFYRTVIENLHGIITFSKGIAIQAKKSGAKMEFLTIGGVDSENNPVDESFYLKGGYKPKWVDFFSTPWSNVFRYSDISLEKEWTNTDIYREVLKPQNLYYGLYTTLVYNDQVLGAFVLWRPKEEGDYTQRDLYIMDTLKNHLALKLYMLQNGASSKTKRNTEKKELDAFAETYALTKREKEILSYLIEDKDSEEIAAKLCISASTLKKHINNIYAKTNCHNRRKLVQLFDGLGSKKE